MTWSRHILSVALQSWFDLQQNLSILKDPITAESARTLVFECPTAVP